MESRRRANIFHQRGRVGRAAVRTEARSWAWPGALLCSLLTACGTEPPPSDLGPRLVVLFAPCTVNRGLLAPYDEAIRFTPNLDAFAAESLVFDRHVTESGQSGIAYASIFTGGQATRHGVYAHPRHIPEELYTLPEAFHDAGYETFFWGGQRMAVASLNGQGLAPGNFFDEGLSAAHPIFRGILERLVAEPDYRALVMTAFTVTHAPYRPRGIEPFCEDFPGECAELRNLADGEFERLNDIYQRNYIELAYDWSETVVRLQLSELDQRRLAAVTNALYRMRIRKLDAAFGRVLDRIDDAGLEQEALVVFTADHGEVMDRRNALFRWTHGHALAPEVLQVPLMLRAPGLGLEPGRYPEVTRSMDLFPTLAGLCGLELPGGTQLEGVDLTGGILGEERRELPGFVHTSLMPHGAEPGAFGPAFQALYPRDDPTLIWVGITTRGEIYKYRNAGDERFVCEVFDHGADPEETDNLFDPANLDHAKMLAVLESYKADLVADHQARRSAGAPELELSLEEQIEALKSLGYVR